MAAIGVFLRIHNWLYQKNKPEQMGCECTHEFHSKGTLMSLGEGARELQRWQLCNCKEFLIELNM